MAKPKYIITALLLLLNSSVFAMQPLDDENLSNATGQDGITIKLQDYQPNARIIWTDNDGMAPADHGIISPQAGSVVFGDGTAAGNFRLSKGDTVITMDTDGNGGNAVLNINIDLPDDLTINTGDVYVAGKDTNNNLVNQTKIMRDMTVKLGGLNINVQLGAAPQGSMMLVTGVVQSGIQVSNIALIGATSGGNEYGIGISQLILKDTGASNDLTFNGMGVSVLSSGLRITPSAGKVVDVLMSDVKVGGLGASDPAIGGVALLGLQLGGTSLTISGH